MQRELPFIISGALALNARHRHYSWSLRAQGPTSQCLGFGRLWSRSAALGSRCDIHGRRGDRRYRNSQRNAERPGARCRYSRNFFSHLQGV